MTMPTTTTRTVIGCGPLIKWCEILMTAHRVQQQQFHKISKFVILPTTTTKIATTAFAMRLTLIMGNNSSSINLPAT